MIKVENIKKKFGNNVVLNGVSFVVKDGEIYGLIGHNGAGKTTLMTIMAGLNKADSGECIFDGKSISYLPDIPGFYDYLTCGEYLDFLFSSLSVKSKRSKAELLRMVGLSEKIRIRSMSRGMRQRLGIGAAIVNDPDVILFDEPTSALDPDGRMEVLDILKSLRNEGKTILFSTHVLTDMESICDEVGFLNDGIIKHQLCITELQDSCSWIVKFRNEIFLESSKKEFFLNRIDKNTYKISIKTLDISKGQEAALLYLASLKQQIESIHNDKQNLDAIFQEVCG